METKGTFIHSCSGIGDPKISKFKVIWLLFRIKNLDQGLLEEQSVRKVSFLLVVLNCRFAIYLFIFQKIS